MTTLRAVPAPLVRGEAGRLTLSAVVKGTPVDHEGAFVYDGEARGARWRSRPHHRFKPCDGSAPVFLYPHEIIEWRPFT